MIRHVAGRFSERVEEVRQPDRASSVAEIALGCGLVRSGHDLGQLSQRVALLALDQRLDQLARGWGNGRR